ncbi:MAG: FHA domain-containing protein [Bacteriovoracaceae bacterium]|jgi:hypothetical protein|nr:hypothetical protein [Halobacteriovoraceae bacterium]MDP7321189.1 FHA domain-containing protein [Bacteriovoracaceae bacterium]|tara:strand:+ start:951 stop:1961 length:1011 start_codon:yes stop_codon:yes gene_type:complete
MSKKIFFHIVEQDKCFEAKHGHIIGRADTCDIKIPDDKVSSKHLRIHVEDDCVYIEDLETSNGTDVNGIELVSLQKKEIYEGDVVTIGEVDLHFSYSDKRPKPTKEVDYSYIDPFKSSTHSQNSELSGIEIEGFDQTNSYFESDLVKEFEKEAQIISEKKNLIKEKKRKIQNLEKKLNQIELKKQRRDDLKQECQNIEKENAEVFLEGPKLKKVYEENADDWQNWGLKIKQLERELNKYKAKKEKIAPKMEVYERYIDLKNYKSELEVQIEEISNINIVKQEEKYFEKIQSYNEQIKESEQKILESQKKQEELKEQEKENIRREIARLQNKLNKAS